MEKIKTIAQLMEKLPEQYQPVVAMYGPIFLKMATEDLWTWIDLMASGDMDNAYRTLVSHMPNQDVLHELDKLNDELDEANEANALRRNIRRDASLAILRVTLQMALALVGL